MIGIGDLNCDLAVYVPHRPSLEEYQHRDTLLPAQVGELQKLVEQLGNHWRKIINLYAKLGFALQPQTFPSWQVYRDEFLLTQNSGHALLFNNSLVTDPRHCVSVISGKTHAAEIAGEAKFQWRDDDFAVDEERPLIVSPYFDYRQLSNAKLISLAGYIKSM